MAVPEKLDVHLVEVKVRATGRLSPTEWAAYRGYPETVIVLISPDGLKANLVSQLEVGEPFLPLGEIALLQLKPELVEVHDRLAKRLLQWDSVLPAEWVVDEP